MSATATGGEGPTVPPHIPMQVTLTFTYQANPERYGTGNPAEMARADQNAFNREPDSLLYLLEREGAEPLVTVTPIGGDTDGR